MSQRITQRPWGEFETLILNTKCTVKFLRLKAGHRTSLQAHDHREELFYLISGQCKVQRLEEIILLNPKNQIIIPKMWWHRITAIEDSLILELSTGTFNEEDIKRIEDDYNRSN